MTNRDVLKKFILETFNIEVEDDFAIQCPDMYCGINVGKCDDCPGESCNGFWDKEFVDNKTMIIDHNGRILNSRTDTKPVNFFEDQKEETNETTAFTSGEISW